RQRQSGAAIVRSMLGKSNNANGATRICSIQCRLWGHCDLQEGGLPCRVPDEIYNQRLSGTETKSSATSLAEVRL
ncbi:MAG: hypothetical protein ONA90_06760, partial [candidate division KSB1 bacterium]|nr:hypothetical protein [candidate division KSB1 bacterium]